MVMKRDTRLTEFLNKLNVPLDDEMRMTIALGSLVKDSRSAYVKRTYRASKSTTNPAYTAEMRAAELARIRWLAADTTARYHEIDARIGTVRSC